MRVELVMICANAHITSTELINPVVHPDGSVEGYAGSARDYCTECESSSMTVLETRTI